MAEVAVGVVAGAAVGAGATYLIMGGLAKLPRIDLSRYQVPVGETYDLICVNFPPNAQLVAPQSLYPPAIVNLGTTDSNGTLVLRGNVARGPAGTYYIIAWNATDGKYCAVVTLFVT